MAEKTRTSKNILIVDDEKLFLKSVADGLKAYEKKNKFKTLTALNGKAALDILDSQEIALLVTDLRMPEMDGLTLISRVHNRFPMLPIIVMTAFGSPEIEKQVRKLGILHYLEKPIGFEEFREHVLHELSQKKRGRIEGITLASFLQLIWMEKTTCTLTVKDGDNVGTLSILNGEMQGAECDGETGRDAALRILSWRNVSIEMDDAFSPSPNPLHVSIEELLIESFRLHDEDNNVPSIEYEDLKGQDRPLTLEGSEMQAEPEPAAEEPALEKKTNIWVTKEERMNVEKLNKSIEVLQENLGGALLASDIFGTTDMQSIAGYNSNPAACALFGQIIMSTNRALKDSGFPILGKYLLFDLVGAKMVVVIPMGDYLWGMLIDGKKAQLGLLLNVALPKAIAAFEDAITS